MILSLDHLALQPLGPSSNNPIPSLYSLLHPALLRYRISCFSAFFLCTARYLFVQDPEAQRRKVCQRLPCPLGGDRKSCRKYRRRSSDDLTGTEHLSLELLANKNAKKQPLERLEKHKKVKTVKATKGVLDCQAPSIVARAIRVLIKKLSLGAIFVMGIFFVCIFCNLCSRCEILHFISSSFLRLLPSLSLSLSLSLCCN